MEGDLLPGGLSTAKMLPYYAERFSSTEVNYTFHRIPSAKTIDGWCKATPEKFKFSLKAPQKVTHFAKLRNCGDTLRYFHQVVCDLEKKLGVVLFQLPPAFEERRGAAWLISSTTSRQECGPRSSFAMTRGSATTSSSC